MAIKIDMLNVGDGDAIFVTLKSGSKTLLIVIDGGDRGHELMVHNKLVEKCKQLGKAGPDLVVCTHYDSYHIAGIIKLVGEFGPNIGEIWFHRPQGVMLNEDLSELVENNTPLNENASFLKSLRLQNNQGSEKLSILLESIRQAKTLEQLINRYKIPRQEPFADECSKRGWPEITIIGPTRQFYDQMLSRSTPAGLISDSVHYMELSESGTRHVRNIKPCASLLVNPVTEKQNQVSVILKIETGGETFLFTGDAGVNSFENASGYPHCITDIHFLKIPHHGSSNNINTDLIERMKPKYAYNSGNEYENANVIGCLEEKGCITRSTRRGNDLCYPC
jgi:beta-lactamase superfamily II metal-dependent hydrolase